MAHQDTYYRRLFSCPDMVRALFDGVIPPLWRQLLDLRHLQPVNLALPTNRGAALRHADLAWLIPRTDGNAICLLLHLEHQSTVDADMALRQATYCCLLYQDIRRRKLVRRPAHLPATLSVVLYTGTRPWRARTDLLDLIDPVPDELAPYQPAMRHLVIDQARLVARQALPANNLAAALFQLEHSRHIDDVPALVHTIDMLTEGHTELRTAFTAWINHVFLPRVAPEDERPSLADLTEIKTMLTERRRHPWSQGLINQGRLEGRQEGRKEGLRLGLLALLTHKFGALPAHATLQMDAATFEQLQQWQVHALEADNLEAVFGSH